MISSKDGIIGLAIGDAMGVPVEFFSREKLIQNPVTTMIGYGNNSMPKGTWSDDTSMNLATIDSIIETKTINPTNIANKFIEWMRNGKYTTDGKVFGIGRTTLMSLSRFQSKQTSAITSGGDRELDNGNGSLMRILPIAYFAFANFLKPDEVLEIVKVVSSITHRHEISILGCYIYVMYAIEVIGGTGRRDAYKKIQNLDYSAFSPETLKVYERILLHDISREYELSEIKSTGYIVDTLEATFWVILNTSNYNQAIIGAINLGNDTDTVGACVGGLAGIIYGLQNINIDWKIDLIKYNYISKLCDKFDIILFGDKKTDKKIDIEVINGNITSLDVDAIVNSANPTLLSGEADLDIYRKAGEKLLSKCEELNGCEYGEAKITRAYNLKSKYIVHTVVPKWYENNGEDKEELLRNCYYNSLKLASDFNCKSIAFPCLGMEIFQCPIDIGVKIAIETVKSYCEKESNTIEKIYFVCKENKTYDYYKTLIH